MVDRVKATAQGSLGPARGREPAFSNGAYHLAGYSEIDVFQYTAFEKLFLPLLIHSATLASLGLPGVWASRKGYMAAGGQATCRPIRRAAAPEE